MVEKCSPSAPSAFCFRRTNHLFLSLFPLSVARLPTFHDTLAPSPLTFMLNFFPLSIAQIQNRTLSAALNDTDNIAPSPTTHRHCAYFLAIPFLQLSVREPWPVHPLPLNADVNAQKPSIPHSPASPCFAVKNLLDDHRIFEKASDLPFLISPKPFFNKAQISFPPPPCQTLMILTRPYPFNSQAPNGIVLPFIMRI